MRAVPAIRGARRGGGRPPGSELREETVCDLLCFMWFMCLFCLSSRKMLAVARPISALRSPVSSRFSGGFPVSSWTSEVRPSQLRSASSRIPELGTRVRETFCYCLFVHCSFVMFPFVLPECGKLPHLFSSPPTARRSRRRRDVSPMKCVSCV